MQGKFQRLDMLDVYSCEAHKVAAERFVVKENDTNDTQQSQQLCFYFPEQPTWTRLTFLIKEA